MANPNDPNSPKYNLDTQLVTRKSLLLRLNADGPARDEAWQKFHDKYAPIIKGFVWRIGTAMALTTHDVDEVAQEVLLGFFLVSPRFKYDPAQGRFRGYLKKCVWTTLQKRYRGRPAVGVRSLEDVDADELQVEAVWNDVWESDLLHRAIAAVRLEYMTHPPQPERSRTFRAFEQVALLDRPADAAAHDLDMSVANIYLAKHRVSKAVAAMMRELEQATG